MMNLRTAMITLFGGFLCIGMVTGQPMNGSTGLLHVPSAEMQQEGTFFTGASYLPEAMTPDWFDYNTGNYYFNITLLPFFEFNYRLTLMKMVTGNTNQDRAFGMRVRLSKEQEKWPSVVVGGNDLYTTSGGSTRYFNSLYAVATKNFALGKSGLGITAGMAHRGFGKKQQGNLAGPFGGVSFSPGFYPPLRLIAEYDSEALNAGATVMLFRHLSLYGMFYKMKIPAGGLAVYLYL